MAERHRRVRAAAVTGVGQLLGLLGSALIGVLVAGTLPPSPRVDGFFGANQIYALSLFLGQAVRITAPALLVRSGVLPRELTRAGVWLTAGTVAFMVFAAIAGASLVAPPARADFTADLLVLAPAAGIHVASGGLAARLAVAGSFGYAASAYAAGSVVAGVILLVTISEYQASALAPALLAGAVSVGLIMLLGHRRVLHGAPAATATAANAAAPAAGSVPAPAAAAMAASSSTRPSVAHESAVHALAADRAAADQPALLDQSENQPPAVDSPLDSQAPCQLATVDTANAAATARSAAASIPGSVAATSVDGSGATGVGGSAGMASGGLGGAPNAGAGGRGDGGQPPAVDNGPEFAGVRQPLVVDFATASGAGVEPGGLASAEVPTAVFALRRIGLGAVPQLAFQVLITVTTVAAGHVLAGGTALLSYAFLALFAFTTIAITPMSIVLGPALAARWDGTAQSLESIVRQATRLATVVAAPLIAVGFLAGRPAGGELLGGALSPAELDTVFQMLAILTPTLLLTAAATAATVGITTADRLGELAGGLLATCAAVIVAGFVIAAADLPLLVIAAIAAAFAIAFAVVTLHVALGPLALPAIAGVLAENVPLALPTIALTAALMPIVGADLPLGLAAAAGVAIAHACAVLVLRRDVVELLGGAVRARSAS